MSQTRADWQHGYYAADGYTYGYYAEMAPTHLAWVALLRGVVMPVERFRYVDLGCGQGLNLILLAACHPDSQFVGIDFMAGHVQHARQLARDAGLSNIRFIEGDFIQLAGSAESLADAAGCALDGEVDYVVAHGIASWVAPPVRSSLWALAGRLLRPGGLHYTSYNTFPGWLATVPFQHLVMLNHDAGMTGDAALQKALDTFAGLEATNAAIFTALPTLKARLNGARTLDSAYLKQEYNNVHWQPQFVADMMAQARDVKLDWLGSAALPEQFDSLMPLQVARLVAAESDPVMQETLRDIAMWQSFRRDTYVKGKVAAWPGERNRLIEQARAVASPFRSVPAGTDGKVEISTGSGKLRVDRDALQKLADAARQPGGLHA